MSDDDFNSKLAEILSRPLLILPPSAHPDTKDPGSKAFFIDSDILRER